MFSKLSDTIRNRPDLKRWLVLTGVVVAAVIVVVVAWPEKPIAEYELTDTGLDAQENFGHLSGSKLYTYNGLAFYEVDLAAGNETTVLSSGTKLPKPGAVYWADSRGALINFAESFTLTQVQSILEARDMRLDEETRSYTWYMDFATGELALVDTLPIAPRLAVYSAEENGFYYVPDQGFGTDKGATVRFYNLETDNSRGVAGNLDLIDVNHLGGCPDTDNRVCLIARDASDIQTEKLYAIGQNGDASLLLDSGGRLYPTNRPELFIAVENGEEQEHDHDDDVPEDVTVPESTGYLHDLRNNSVSELDFMIGSSDIAVHFSSSDEFYVLNNYLIEDDTADDEPSTYRVGEITPGGNIRSQQHDLTYGKESPFLGELSDRISHGAGELSLIETFDGRQLLLSYEQSSYDFTRLGQQSAQEVVDNCIESGGEDSQYFDSTRLFKVYFTGYDGLGRKISSFSDCVTEANPSALLGYNFYFGVLDPVNGRIVSD